MIKLELTKEQAEQLYDALTSYQDEGPVPNGWRSKELTELINCIEQQIKKSETKTWIHDN